MKKYYVERWKTGEDGHVRKTIIPRQLCHCSYYDTYMEAAIAVDVFEWLSENNPDIEYHIKVENS